MEENQFEDVVNSRQLRERLLRLHAQAKADPFFAIVNAPDGSCLAVGLGRDMSVLSYTAPGGWPAKHVLADTPEVGLVNYKFLGQFSEMPVRYAIPIGEAVDAVVEFFDSGRLSAKLRWEND